MATQYGDNATKRSVNKPSEKIDSCDDRGRVRVSHDEITPSANIPVADKIILGRLPKGARLLYAKVAGTVSAGAADLGWEASSDGGEAGDADGVSAAQDLSSNALIVSADKKMDGEVDISATVTTEIVADGKISVSYYYSLD